MIKKRKVSKKPSVKWVVIGFFFCFLLIGTIAHNSLKYTTKMEVAGASTNSTVYGIPQLTPPSESLQLTCAQCRRQVKSGQTASLCLFSNGSSSYASCQTISSINSGANTSCVSCGTNQCTPKPPITPTCQPVVLQTLVFSNACSQSNTYHSVSYTCSDGYKGQVGNSNICINAIAWKTYVTKICQNHKNCGSIVSPGPDGWCTSVTPSPQITQVCKQVCTTQKGFFCQLGRSCPTSCHQVCVNPY